MASMSTFPVPPKRTKQVKFYASEEERAELDRVAAKLELGVSDVIRSALNEYFDKLRKRGKI